MAKKQKCIHATDQKMKRRKLLTTPPLGISWLGKTDRLGETGETKAGKIMRLQTNCDNTC